MGSWHNPKLPRCAVQTSGAVHRSLSFSFFLLLSLSFFFISFSFSFFLSFFRFRFRGELQKRTLIVASPVGIELEEISANWPQTSWANLPVSPPRKPSTLISLQPGSEQGRRQLHGMPASAAPQRSVQFFVPVIAVMSPARLYTYKKLLSLCVLSKTVLGRNKDTKSVGFD